MIRTIVSVFIVALCTLITGAAQADTRVTVHDFYGPNADRVRDDVVNLLERQSGVTIVSKGQIENAAARLGVDPYSPEGRIALGRDLQLSAWMTGVVAKRSGKLKLTVVVFEAAQHRLVGRARLSGKTLSQLSGQIRDRLWRKSRNAIFQAAQASSGGAAAVASAAKVDQPAPEGTPVAEMVVSTGEAESAPAPAAESGEAPAASESTRDAEEPETRGESAVAAADEDYEEGDEPQQKQGEIVRAFLGFGSPYRNLSYESPITSTLGDYQLPGAPMLDLNLAFHPARPFTAGFASWFAIEARVQFALAAPTIDRDGNQFSSRYDSYQFGLRARIPLGKQYLSAFTGYAMNRFSVTSEDKDVSTPMPSVDYRMLRTGAGAEFALGESFDVGVDAAWLSILSVGDIGKWFPRAEAGGLEFAASATYSLTPGIFARASASYARAFFDFNPRPDDKYAAQGATDQYLSLSLGAGVKL